jgi:hypothetical protein
MLNENQLLTCDDNKNIDSWCMIVS